MKFTIKQKLITFLSFALIISLSIGLIGFLNLLTLKKLVSYNENIVAKPLACIAKTSIAFGSARAIIRDLIISEGDPDEKLHDRLVVSLDIIKTQLDSYTATLIQNGSEHSEEHGMVISLITQTKEWTTQVKLGEEMIQNDKKSEAIGYLKSTVQPHAEAINQSIEALIDLNKKQASVSSQSAEQLFAKVIVKMIFVILVGIFVLAFLGLVIIRSITKPVDEIILVGNQLAENETSNTKTDV